MYTRPRPPLGRPREELVHLKLDLQGRGLREVNGRLFVEVQSRLRFTTVGTSMLCFDTTMAIGLLYSCFYDLKTCFLQHRDLRRLAVAGGAPTHFSHPLVGVYVTGRVIFASSQLSTSPSRGPCYVLSYRGDIWRVIAMYIASTMMETKPALHGVVKNRGLAAEYIA